MPRPAPHGFTRIPVHVHVPLAGLNGTGAVIVHAAKALAFRYRLEAAYIYAPGQALTGGNRTLRILKGATVLYTLACGSSNFGTAGNVVDMTASVTDPQLREYGDADQLVVDIASGGTAITAGQLTVVLIVREIDQAAA